MKKRINRAICLLLAALVCFALAACGSMKSVQTGAVADEEGYYREAPAAAEMDAKAYNGNGVAAVKESGATAGSGFTVYQNQDVKLIRRAWLNVESTQFDTSVQALTDLTAQLNGYFESSEVYTNGYYAADQDLRTGNYVVRIPAAQYDKFMASLDGLGTVTHKNESSEDVGQAYHDVESRLKTQRIKQERLQALLEKADKMEDIIALESALSDVEYMIESYSSDLRRYDGLIDYATVTVGIEEVVRVSVTAGEKQPLLERLGAGVVSSAQDFIDGVQETFIWISYHLIGLAFTAAVIVAGVVLIKRAVKKVKKHPAPKGAEPADKPAGAPQN